MSLSEDGSDDDEVFEEKYVDPNEMKDKTIDEFLDNDDDLTDAKEIPKTRDKIVEIYKNRYFRYDVLLGSGSFKKVYKCFDQEEGLEVAWCVVDFGALADQTKKRVRNEFKVWKDIEHPHIVTLQDTWFDKKNDQVVFITEMFDGGNLKQFMKDKGQQRIGTLKKWAKCILQALAFLHEKLISHRDIKSENIYINKNGTIKIGDYGLASKQEQHNSIVGTPVYMAPEILNSSQCEDGYTQKCDIWSYGIMTLELVVNEIPYSELHSLFDIMSSKEKVKLPESLFYVDDRHTFEFIASCLLPNSAYRSSAQTLLNSDFFKYFNNDKHIISTKNRVYSYKDIINYWKEKFDYNLSEVIYKFYEEQDNIAMKKEIKRKNKLNKKIELEASMMFAKDATKVEVQMHNNQHNFNNTSSQHNIQASRNKPMPSFQSQNNIHSSPTQIETNANKTSCRKMESMQEIRHTPKNSKVFSKQQTTPFSSMDESNMNGSKDSLVEYSNQHKQTMSEVSELSSHRSHRSQSSVHEDLTFDESLSSSGNEHVQFCYYNYEEYTSDQCNYYILNNLKSIHEYFDVTFDSNRYYDFVKFMDRQGQGQGQEKSDANYKHKHKQSIEHMAVQGNSHADSAELNSRTKSVANGLSSVPEQDTPSELRISMEYSKILFDILDVQDSHKFDINNEMRSIKFPIDKLYLQKGGDKTLVKILKHRLDLVNKGIYVWNETGWDQESDKSLKSFYRTYKELLRGKWSMIFREDYKFLHDKYLQKAQEVETKPLN